MGGLAAVPTFSMDESSFSLPLFLILPFAGQAQESAAHPDVGYSILFYHDFIQSEKLSTPRYLYFVALAQSGYRRISTSGLLFQVEADISGLPFA